MPSTAASQPHEAPDSDVRLVLWRVSMMAVIASMPRKRSEKMLRVFAQLLAEEEALSSIFPIRGPPPVDDAQQKARRGALALFRANLPAFLAMLDRG